MKDGVQIFFYGTLRGHPGCGERVGEDRIPGILYDLGTFPGYRREKKGWVVGEVREIPPLLLETLDRYEGVDRGLYTRERVVTQARRKVWVYEINPDLVAGVPIIPSGDWFRKDLPGAYGEDRG